MYRKNGKKFLVSILAVMAILALFGTSSWAANPLVFSSSAGQLKGAANNGAFTVSGNGAIASTTIYSIPGVNSQQIKIQANVGGGDFNDKDTLTVKSSSSHWVVSFTGQNNNVGSLADPTTLELVSDTNEANLPVSEDVTITITDSNHSESITLTVNKTVVNLPLALPNVALYQGGDYTGDKAQAVKFPINGKSMGTVGGSGHMAFFLKGDTNTPLSDPEQLWADSNSFVDLAVDTTAVENPCGVFFYAKAKPLTGGPHEPTSVDVALVKGNGQGVSRLLVLDDNNAIVAGTQEGTKIATLSVSIAPAVLSLSPSSLDITVGTDAGKASPVVASIMGKDMSYLKIADADGKNRADNKLMPCGINIAVSGDKTPATTKEIILSGVPTSADKSTYRVVAFDEANTVIASTDLTVTVGTAQPVAGYTMTVENFAAVASKDVGTQAHAISFKKDGSSIDMPVLETLAFTQPSDPADPSKVVWNGLTLVADKATGKVTMTGTPQADGSKSFTLHATSQAGTIADWAFSVTVSKSQPTPSSGGSSGCDAGFGFAGLLALGAFAGLFRRGK